MTFEQLPEFKKDLRKLLKKFSTLEDDLETLKKVLKDDPRPSPPQRVQISGIGIDYPKIIKVRRFACRALKGKGGQSGIRVVYAFFPDESRVEFVEIYHKGVKELEDRERILEYYR